MAASAVAMPLQSFNDEGTPILSASITASFEAGYADVGESSPGVENSGFLNGRWGEVYFSGEMTADNGLVYGARINLQTTLGPGAGIGRANQGREYLYLKGGWGSLELGKTGGAETALHLNVAGQYKGGGAFDWPVYGYGILGSVGLGVQNNPNWWDTQQTKASYFTPVINGIQAGISYTPSVSATADTTLRGPGGFQDEIGYGVQYNGDFDGTTISLSAVGATSDDDDTNGLRGIGFYQVSGIIRHAGASFGAGFWDAGDQGTADGRDQEWTGWMVDAAYSFGPYGLEVSYVHTERNRTGGGVAADMRDVDGWALSLGYALAPGLRIYGDLISAEYAINGESYESSAAIGGVTLSF